MAEPAPIIKKRSRPQARVRQASIERDDEEELMPENEEEAGLPYVLHLVPLLFLPL